MPVLAEFNPVADSGLINRIGQAQSLMNRAQEMKIRRERHELDKQAFAQDLITMDLDQRFRETRLKTAKLEMATVESRADAQQLEVESELNALQQQKQARLAEVEQADAARIGFQAVMREADNRDTVPVIERQHVLDKWINDNQNIVTSGLNPALQQEFGALIAQVTSKQNALRGEFGLNVMRSAGRLTGRVASATSMAELDAIATSPDFQYAKNDEIFQKNWTEAVAHQRKVQLEEVKAANSKTKIPSESMKRFSSIVAVADSIDKIEELFEDVSTGPIIGIFRSKNPYDVKAQRLRTYVESTVPGLARGVFGEVGVLTDTDVERYTKALPNLKSTAELSQYIMSDLRDRLNSQWERNVEVFGAAGYQVEGLRGLMTRRNAESQGVIDTVTDEDFQ